MRLAARRAWRGWRHRVLAGPLSDHRAEFIRFSRFDMFLQGGSALSPRAPASVPYHHRTVTLEGMTTAELLDAWRDASRAADLAERLAEVARRVTEKGDQDAATALEIAALADEVAASAERASRAARAAAQKASEHASRLADQLSGADQAVNDARTEETGARDRYHDAEAEAHRQHDE
jgi:hypothetical protein